MVRAWAVAELRLTALVLLALSCFAAPAAAQEIPGFQHRHWTATEGAPLHIRAIAQTVDGYLWLGTSNGLYRFDGLIFEKIVPAVFDRMRSNQVTALAAAPDGTLWVGYDYGGLAVYRDGKLRSANPGKPRGVVNSIAIAPDGGVWVAVVSALGHQLRHFRNGKWLVREPGRGMPAEPVQRIQIEPDGTMWLGMFPSLYRVAAGGFAPRKVGDRINVGPVFAHDEKGGLWLYTNNGLNRIGGSIPSLQVGVMRGGMDGQWGLLIEDGWVWIAGGAAGLARIPEHDLRLPATIFTPSQISTLFRDREGSIWGGGSDGLHRYVRSAIVPVTTAGVLSTGIIAARDDSNAFYFGTDHGLFRIRDAKIEKVNDDRHTIQICTGPKGRMHTVSSNDETSIENGRMLRHKGPMGRRATGRTCGYDAQGTLWESLPGTGTFRRVGSGWVKETDWPFASHMIATGRRSFLYSNPMRDVSWLDDGRVTPIWQGDKIPVAFVRLLARDNGHLYVGGDAGLARVERGKTSVLAADRYPFLAAVTGIVSHRGETWVIAGSGIVRMRSADLDRAFDKPGTALPVQAVGKGEGIFGRSFAYAAGDATVDAQGRLWFVTSQGLIRVAPERVAARPGPPPVAISHMFAGEHRVGKQQLDLPAGSDRFAIEYTALSLVESERNQFRYRLEGVDRDWINAGNRRRADYVGLGPGHYRFQVIAAGADGAWNLQGATVSFTIAPYFWQTWWFRGLVLGLFALGLFLFVRWRLRVAVRITQQRFDTRVAERERIARELHDTLLQGFQGLILRFQSVLHLLPEKSPAKQQLDAALERADDVMLLGRERVHDLRQESSPKHLDALLRLSAERILGDALPWKLEVRGVPQPVVAPVAEEVGLIVGEALTNALRHSRGTKVLIELIFSRTRVEIGVTDDGVGYPHDKPTIESRQGHFGLIGMAERAKQLGSTISFESDDGAGSVVRVTLPGRIAYQ